MRCTVEGCNITSKHPQKAMCWKDFGMCKYHAFIFYPEVYEPSGYRPSSSKWDQILAKLEYGV